MAKEHLMPIQKCLQCAMVVGVGLPPVGVMPFLAGLCLPPCYGSCVALPSGYGCLCSPIIVLLHTVGENEDVKMAWGDKKEKKFTGAKSWRGHSHWVAEASQ